jgi:hypothetical protein
LLLGASITFGVLVVAPVAYHYVVTGGHPAQFDSKGWKELGRPSLLTESGTRWQMADDLVKNHRLDNMERSEVLDLLGSPDQGARLSRDSVPCVYSYSLEPTMNEIRWLVIQFDVEDLVIDASMREY